MVYDSKSARSMSEASERAHRDAATTAAHEEYIQRTGEKRILVRAVNGELLSYTPDEYGVSRTGLGPKISTWWGHLVYVLAILVITMIFLYLPIHGMFVERDPEAGWFLIVTGLFVLLGIYATRNFRREWRAHQLRKERGLPRPIQ
ncbi:hypothetical protein GCM10027403_01100 [Arthrobacter tecti]